jgi:hypothetical protein
LNKKKRENIEPAKAILKNNRSLELVSIIESGELTIIKELIKCIVVV